MEYSPFWQAISLLFCGMYTIYCGMKWKETGLSKYAFYFGICIMATVMNFKPFV